MQGIKPIDFLPKPQIDPKSLSKFNSVSVYANLFEMKFTKEIKMYQYHFEVNPEIK